MSARLAQLVAEAERAGAEPDGLDEWLRVGRRLALVDRARFEWMLRGADAIVMAYVATDPAQAVAAMNAFLEGDEPVRQGGN